MFEKPQRKNNSKNDYILRLVGDGRFTAMAV
jgi:hypothetical protein